MADWTTIASLATAGGTLVLAVATFSAVRSSNRSARIAEQALQEQRRPLLVNARLDDPVQKVMFIDGHWMRAQGSEAVIDQDGDTIYIVLPLRNAGAGIAVIQGWYPWPELATSDIAHVAPDEFRRQTRDIFIAPGDIGLWQGALRDRDDELRAQIAVARTERHAFSLDLLYSDQIGGQRTISRFALAPLSEDHWLGAAGRHWNLDAANPR